MDVVRETKDLSLGNGSVLVALLMGVSWLRWKDGRQRKQGRKE
jgi:hypothetical protein